MKNQINGKDYWRSLDQLADTPEFRQFAEREFPEGASELSEGVNRRTFLSLMGASLALAGLAGCRRPVEKIIPYVTPPENIIPGIPKFYATTMPNGLDPIGLLAENHEGRPTKLEGNPKHPSSLGATNHFIQAEILNLYDPDRSQSVRNNGSERSIEDFSAFWRSRLPELKENQGAGLAILSESFASPTLARLKQELLEVLPQARWFTWEPISDENIFNALTELTGQTYRPQYQFDKAQVILSLEADFLQLETGAIANTKGFSAGRRVETENDSMNRLYAVESGFSITGGMADHHLRMAGSRIPAFTLALAHELIAQGLTLPGGVILPHTDFNTDQKFLRILAKDLLSRRGNSLITAGRHHPVEVHLLVLLLNTALGNVGKTVDFYPVQDAVLPSTVQLIELVNGIEANEVTDLVILGGNPVYNAPTDLDFASVLGKVENSTHLSSHYDETSQLTNWHIHRTHFLEDWGDTVTVTGTKSIIQPQIDPLFGAHSAVELLAILTTGEKTSGYDLVRATWKNILSGDFESEWRKVLHDGLYTGKKPNPVAQQKLQLNLLSKYKVADSVLSVSNLELVLLADASTFDGRYANNGWLQEMPDPITKLTWDNAAVMNRKTAEELGLKNYDIIELTHAGRTVSAPVWIVPGRADYSIGLSLGYGRSAAGRIGNNVGTNAYRLRTSENKYFLTGVSIFHTTGTHELACTQDHHGLDLEALASKAIERRLPVLYREATLDEYRSHPDFAAERVEHPPLVSMWEEHSYDEGYQWGMTIDLNVCTGCNACSIACQSENNIPIVGKQEVAKGREMAWLRMDRYFSGSEEAPEMVHQPVACQHCENAPCEQVCPVAATVHDSEGLNTMTYNRCVGTRYCANNCPYKVRRFNFYNYTKETPDIVEMSMNPDVTVRTRGVMEKCSFCVQRISTARIKAKNEGQEIRDGEVQSACQQTCPADAIVFGNINDPNSQVARVKQQNRNYALLGEINTKPRTTYLAKIRNPHPELATDV